MFKHLDVQAIADELDIWVTTCNDFPMKQKREVLQDDGTKVLQTVFKEGIHIYIPEIVADRRKLLEIRNDAYEYN